MGDNISIGGSLRSEARKQRVEDSGFLYHETVERLQKFNSISAARRNAYQVADALDGVVRKAQELNEDEVLPPEGTLFQVTLAPNTQRLKGKFFDRDHLGNNPRIANDEEVRLTGNTTILAEKIVAAEGNIYAVMPGGKDCWTLAVYLDIFMPVAQEASPE